MMNDTEKKNVARAATLALFADIFAENDAVQNADASHCILQVVEGQEIWTEVTVKTKAFKATKVSPAFDPYVAAEAWKEEKRIKAEEKERKAAEKAAKKGE